MPNQATSEGSAHLHLGSALALLKLSPYLALMCGQRGLVCFKQPLEVL
jgi:hypothetical protein